METQINLHYAGFKKNKNQKIKDFKYQDKIDKRTRLYRKSFLQTREKFNQEEHGFFTSPTQRINFRSPLYDISSKLNDFRGGSEKHF